MWGPGVRAALRCTTLVNVVGVAQKSPHYLYWSLTTTAWRRKWCARIAVQPRRCEGAIEIPPGSVGQTIRAQGIQIDFLSALH